VTPERGHSLRAKWALRFYALTTSGLDDHFAGEVFDLVQDFPNLLDELEELAGGRGRAARQKRDLIRLLRQAQAKGARTLY
jgi:hypothetical protein